MIDYKLVYELNTIIDNNIIQHLFISQGIQDIVKVIHYQKIFTYESRAVFNLGFGNYDPATNKISDTDISNNGDHYHIFNTVLSTIPVFFNLFPDSVLAIAGSDSHKSFITSCKTLCTKKCPVYLCKNFRRRIRTYLRYVEKNWILLNKEYTLKGGILNSENIVEAEEYVPGNAYDTILVFKRKL